MPTRKRNGKDESLHIQVARHDAEIQAIRQDMQEGFANISRENANISREIREMRGRMVTNWPLVIAIATLVIPVGVIYTNSVISSMGTRIDGVGESVKYQAQISAATAEYHEEMDKLSRGQVEATAKISREVLDKRIENLEDHVNDRLKRDGDDLQFYRRMAMREALRRYGNNGTHETNEESNTP